MTDVTTDPETTAPMTLADKLAALKLEQAALLEGAKARTVELVEELKTIVTFTGQKLSPELGLSELVARKPRTRKEKPAGAVAPKAKAKK